MPRMTPMTERERLELQGAFNRLTDYLNVAPPLVERCINTPATGSRLAAEASDDDSFNPTSMAALYLTGAVEHLGLVHQGLSAKPITTLAILTVVRGALEGSVRAVWLLEPMLTTRQRIERGLLERCANIHSWNRVQADPARLAARAAQIRSVAATHSIPLDGQLYGTPLPRRIGGNTRPSTTKLAQDALVALKRGNPTDAVAAERERWFFAWLSAVAHSAPWALIKSQSDLQDTPAGSYPTAQVSGNAINLAAAIDLVRHIHRLAVQRLALLSGHQEADL
jgi:hypothetical protein